MDLEKWMLKNGIETSELARMLGVCRQVVWKVKTGKTCDQETADKIRFVTGGAVNPRARLVGRPRKRS